MQQACQFQRFGIGEPMGTGFPGESSGLLPNRARWYSTEKISLAFGYGITTTPLQLARAYTAFATGGLQRPVSLLALDGEVPEPRRVISETVASQVLAVLHAVTGEHGTARKARVEGFNVAGKTGTVRKVGPGGYIEDSHVALFAGLAPVDDPRVVTVVVINDPQGEDYGGGEYGAGMGDNEADYGGEDDYGAGMGPGGGGYPGMNGPNPVVLSGSTDAEITPRVLPWKFPVAKIILAL